MDCPLELGVGFKVLQWSVTGTTPGESDGNSRIICSGIDFTDARTDTTTTGSVTLLAADNANPLWFEFLRPSNIYFK